MAAGAAGMTGNAAGQIACALQVLAAQLVRILDLGLAEIEGGQHVQLIQGGQGSGRAPGRLSLGAGVER